VATEEDPHPIVPDETPDPTDPGRHPGGWEKILLVDDNGPAREAIARILRRLGYTVLEAGDGESALAKARDLKEVDLLVTDLLMPGMSGFSLAERVEEELGPHRILYMSGYVQAEVAWKGAPGAAVDFLEKPMSTEDLAGRVRAILDRTVSGSGERAASPVS
jgi:two-component system, cell cycle sensor histidine kinase and response regulator CckA